MQYLELKNHFKNFVVFSLRDIRKIEPAFYRQRLSEWQKKGYIKKVINEYYIFSDLEINELVLFIIANKICDPSYVSLEMALSYYGLIPESVYAITSVTSRKTHIFDSALGNFHYRKISPKLMFGYRLEKYGKRVFKIAEIEKAFLDYFYLNAHIKTNDDFFELRINSEIFLERVDRAKLKRYLEQFSNQSLKKRIDNFLNFINND